MEKKDITESEEDISATYYFESDHVAFKENSDYREMLRTIAVLEAQRQQAARDIESLYKEQENAFAQPLQFVEKLQQGKDLGLPKPQVIPSLPDIQWDKYTHSSSFTAFGSSRHMTRNKKTASEGDAVQGLKQKLIQGNSSNADDVIIVRGRQKDSSKPATFNQLWTEEEQQKLESLLKQFPPEEVQSRRWERIAQALGNRTSVQVASRVQKYFVKLAKEGLAVPGPTPNLTAYAKKNSHRHHRYNRMYYPTSTFMQSHLPPVWMPDEPNDGNTSEFAFGANPGERTASFGGMMAGDDSSDDEEFPEEVRQTPEFRELQQLKRIRKEAISKEKASTTKHIGYKCDICGCEPIVGTRWHCQDCPPEVSYDFCDACCDSSFQQGDHDSSHRLQPFSEGTVDSDYTMSFAENDYNYLDSNYMPAT